MGRKTLRFFVVLSGLGLACSSSPGGDGSGGTGNADAAGGSAGAKGGAAGAAGSAAGTGGSSGNGGATGGAGANADGGLTTEQVCAESAGAICEKYRDCIPSYFAQWYGDMSSCVTTLMAISCRFRLNAPGTGDTLATIAACAAARRMASCGEAFENEVVACLPQRGSLPNGAKCATSSQCQSQFCSVLFGSDCGTCTPTVAAGGRCTGAPGECSGTLMCVNEVCGSMPKIGEACAQGAGCRFGLVCVNGVCAAPANAGEPCTVLACNVSANLSCRNGICEPRQYVGAGERCEIPEGPFCGRATFCKSDPGSASGVCVPPADEGQACDDVNGPECVASAVCRMGVCRVPDSTVCN